MPYIYIHIFFLKSGFPCKCAWQNTVLGKANRNETNKVLACNDGEQNKVDVRQIRF